MSRNRRGSSDGVGSDSVAIEMASPLQAKAKIIENSIANIKEATKVLYDTHEQMRNTSDSDYLSELSAQTTKVALNTQKEVSNGRLAIDALKAECEKLEKEDVDLATAYRARHKVLVMNYVMAVRDHQKAKELLRKFQVDDLTRRGTTMWGNEVEDDIRARVEDDPHYIQKRMDEEMEASEEAQQAYREAQSRATDVERLIKSLNAVSEMFHDLASLIQQQGDMIDSISNHVERTSVNVKKGNEELRDAIKHQKRTRKCMCCFVCILIIIILIVVVAVGSFFGVSGG